MSDIGTGFVCAAPDGDGQAVDVVYAGNGGWLILPDPEAGR